MYVSVQSVFPSMFQYGDVPRVSFRFSFLCVNWIICCISNAAHSFTCILQLKYNIYFSIVWEGKMTQDKACGCMLGQKLWTWDRIQKRGEVKSESIFHTLCTYRAYSLPHWLTCNDSEKYNP